MHEIPAADAGASIAGARGRFETRNRIPRKRMAREKRLPQQGSSVERDISASSFRISRFFQVLLRVSAREDLPLRSQLARASHHIFIAGELLDTDGTTGVKLIGGNADLRAHAEFAAIGELS